MQTELRNIEVTWQKLILVHCAHFGGMFAGC